MIQETETKQEWASFFGQCEKHVYDLKLHDGRLMLAYWPVGDYFVPLHRTEEEREKLKLRRRKVMYIRRTTINIWI